MRKLAIALVLIMGSSPALAAPLNCWYDAQGNSTGADSGNMGYPVGQTTKTNDGWVYVIPDGQWVDGNSCPARVPG